MFLDRIVIFLVLGFFVFSPTIGGWWGKGVASWYLNYLPWLFLIALCFWFEFRQRNSMGD